MLHLVAEGVQKWTVDAQNKIGSIERIPDYLRTASIMTKKIKYKLNKLSEQKHNMRVHNHLHQVHFETKMI